MGERGCAFQLYRVFSVHIHFWFGLNYSTHLIF